MLPSRVWHTTFDAHGTLWIASESGLHRYSKASGLSLIEGLDLSKAETKEYAIECSKDWRKGEGLKNLKRKREEDKDD